MNEYKLVPILNTHVDEWWPVIEGWVQYACDHNGGRYDPPHIREKAKEGAVQIWLVMKEHIIKALCVTEVFKLPKIIEFRMIIMTGEDMREWVYLLSSLEQYAKSLGCARIIGIARPGWERILKPFGYKLTHVTVERDLC